MLEALGFVDHTVQIGVGVAGTQLRHNGVATAQGRKIPFVVDRPAKLKSPKMSTVVSIFKQFEQLGNPAQLIELTAGRRRRVYALDNGYPRLVQSVSA